MAEITAQNLYNQLSPLEKQQYDGVMGMGGFKERYEKNPDSQLVKGDVNYSKFKAIADAEAAVPEEGFFKSLISSASAAEPDKINNVSNTAGFQIIAKPDGTIEVIPPMEEASVSDFPFKSMAELAAANAISNPFQRTTSVAPVPPGSFDPGSMQSIFSPDVKTGIMSQAPTSLGFDTSFNVANEPDVEQEDEEKSGGILDFLSSFIPGLNFLKNFEGQPYERFTPGASIKGGIYSIGDFNQPVGLVNDFFNPRTGLNRFQRAEERYKRTGSLADLFASSRSGAEFFRKKRERDAIKQRALENSAKVKRDASQFTGGPGRDTFEPSAPTQTQRQAGPGFRGSGTAAEMGSF